MKRAPELKQLSEEHHLALVLARTARRAARGGEAGEVAKAWREIAGKYGAELAPHFKIEEETLAPALQAAGEAQLVERLLEDHRYLQALVEGADHSPAALEAFGDRLDAHVRFEERELFERAQAVLAPEALERVFDACTNRSKTGGE